MSLAAFVAGGVTSTVAVAVVLHVLVLFCCDGGYVQFVLLSYCVQQRKLCIDFLLDEKLV